MLAQNERLADRKARRCNKQYLEASMRVFLEDADALLWSELGTV